MNCKLFIFFVSAFLLANTACQTVTAPNTNAAKNGVMTDQKELPPGFSNNAAAPINGAVPGIPANGAAGVLPKGATPTPGIPADPGKPLPKGATPTPGIPDQETLKKQLNQKLDSNIVNNPSPNGGDARPRRVEKP